MFSKSFLNAIVFRSSYSCSRFLQIFLAISLSIFSATIKPFIKNYIVSEEFTRLHINFPSGKFPGKHMEISVLEHRFKAFDND